MERFTIEIILYFSASGGDLQRLLDEQLSLPESTARSLLHQVLQGLRFLHINHIAHLDIKVSLLYIIRKLDNLQRGLKIFCREVL